MGKLAFRIQLAGFAGLWGFSTCGPVWHHVLVAVLLSCWSESATKLRSNFAPTTQQHRDGGAVLFQAADRKSEAHPFCHSNQTPPRQRRDVSEHLGVRRTGGAPAGNRREIAADFSPGFRLPANRPFLREGEIRRGGCAVCREAAGALSEKPVRGEADLGPQGDGP